MSRPGSTAMADAVRASGTRTVSDFGPLRRTNSSNTGALYRTLSNTASSVTDGIRPRTPLQGSGSLGSDYFSARAPELPHTREESAMTMQHDLADHLEHVQEEDSPDTPGRHTPEHDIDLHKLNTHQAALLRLRPPPISFSWKDKASNIFIGWLVVLMFDLILPCILYYLLKRHTDLEDYTILGISVAALGIGELIELPLRMWRLGRHRSTFGPLGTEVWWHFDVVTWFYLMLTIIAVTPFAVSTSVDPLLYDLFLMSTAIIIGVGTLLAFITLFDFRAPFRLSSDPKGAKVKPAAYYVMEDFIAVDAGQGRRFRMELRDRYEASDIFRQVLFRSTAWWALGGLVYVGISLAITYGTDFDTAYGLIFGTLFLWILVWALVNWYYVHSEMKREKQVWLLRHKDHE